MDLKKIKTAAAGHGYRLVRNSKRTEPLKPCSCGHNRRYNINGGRFYSLKCMKCGFRVTADSYWDARMAWNEAMK